MCQVQSTGGCSFKPHVLELNKDNVTSRNTYQCWVLAQIFIVLETLAPLSTKMYHYNPCCLRDCLDQKVMNARQQS